MDDMRDKRSQESNRVAARRQRRIVRRATLKAECVGLFRLSGSFCSEFQSPHSTDDGVSRSGIIAAQEQSPRIHSRSRNGFTKHFARCLGFACRVSRLVFQWIHLFTNKP